jgi:para-aminobenzoate synthetase component 1
VTQQLPLAIELRPVPDVEAALLRLAALPYSLLLDSALHDPRLGRYSFLMADPFEVLTVPADGSDGLVQVEARLKHFAAEADPALPPFQGGAAGLFSYDLGRSLEELPQPPFDEFQLPALVVGLYDTVLAFDHVEHRAWLISQGFAERVGNALRGVPRGDSASRLSRAQARIEEFQALLAGEELRSSPGTQPSAVSPSGGLLRKPQPPDSLAPQFPIPVFPGLTSNFSAAGYKAAVQRAIDYIYAGDVFQVNLSQRLMHPAACEPLALYLRLRQCNPAPFAGWFDAGDFQVISASPERFLSVQGREVEARPIKGTRRRTAWAEADLFAGDDLLASEKDRAENVMIVDLLRNDLSRVCDSESVRVTQLCGLELYQFVQHLVSVVRGTLTPGKTAIDLIRAAFPGGSITGAPKVRAMEIIAELEPTARGPYCGSLGYIGFDGAADLSILIRTITAAGGWWQFPVGGGIVAQSSPDREYEETWHKAEGLLRAIRV